MVNAAVRLGAMPLLIEVTPLRDSTNELGDSIHGVSVLLIDARLSGSIRTDRVAHWAQLTTSEAHVCRYLVDGLTNGDIAERRGTSIDTVKSQVSNALSKCKAGNRTELVRIAMRTSPPIGDPDEISAACMN